MSLNLKSNQTFKLYNDWSSEYLEHTDDTIHISFSDSFSIGSGSTKHNINNNSYQIQIGIAPISLSIFKRRQMINDLDFIRIGVTMFHEFAHYDQNSSNNTSKEILISDLSKYKNVSYYEQNWSKFPHEIDAEYTGVMSMWEHLKDIYPDNADILILEYITYRATKTDYIFKIPEEGLQSKDQVEMLFEKAYDDSLITSRKLSVEFFRSYDEIAQLFTNNACVLRSEYYPFYRQIQIAKTGQETDLKMASLVSYIHPELQKVYPLLDFSKLNPSSIFGISIPETRKDILDRIEILSDDISDIMLTDDIHNFTKAVAKIPISDDQLKI